MKLRRVSEFAHWYRHHASADARWRLATIPVMYLGGLALVAFGATLSFHGTAALLGVIALAIGWTGAYWWILICHIRRIRNTTGMP